ncbi:MAG TPA: response regulator [Pyrinomonadaceae bacterium]|jgi:RNA polymerase sigma factor (sigma-70 family)
MAKATIVVADNDHDFLEELGDFLKRGGYSVILAKSLEEAKKILQKRRYDLVILDVRLTDDRDADDNSGLMLARSVSTDVPKIILTKMPNYDVVRGALGPGVKGLPVAVDFVAKKEIVERLLPALEDAIFIKELQDGDDKAWERFWKMEAWSIIALCRRHGIEPKEAVAISMDIFAELAKLIKRPLKRSSLRAQLVSKALQRINERRSPGRKSKSGASHLQAGVPGVLLANEELLRDIAATAIKGKLPREEMNKRLTDAIKKLPSRQRRVVTLRLFRSVSTSDIAKELGVTEKTVLKDMDQGFRQVRSTLTQLGE